MTDHIDLLKTDVADHGEVHAHIEEAGREQTVELRQGTVTWDDTHGAALVEGSDTQHRLPYDRIVDWYKPRDYYHEEH